MKKSRIIIPALALIAFSVAASVTGAVAWFTASRQARIDAGTYAVVKTSANLDVELTSGAHTTASNNTVEVNGVLSDGSFDHRENQEKIFTPALDGKSLKSDTNGPIAIGIADDDSDADTDTYTDVANALHRGQTAAKTVGTTTIPSKNIYTAATFDIKFTVSFGAVAGDIGLYLDNTVTRNDQNVITARKTNFRVDSTDPNVEAKTAQGFRMAFIPLGTNASSGYRRVLADLQETTESYTDTNNQSQTRTAIKHIDGSSPAASFSNGGATYETNEVIDASYEAALPTSQTDRAAALARPDCLGTFTFSSGNQVTLSFRVVCWFEGTDPEIVNRDMESEYQAVIATLCFEAVDLKNA